MSWLLEHLTLMGAIIGAAGALLVGVGAFREQRAQVELSRQLAAKSDQLVRRADESAELYRQLAQKSDEIESLTKQNLAAVTGGAGFSYLNLVSRGSPAGPSVVLVQSGEFPIYDVSVRIVDVEKWSALKPEQITIEGVPGVEFRLSAGNLAAGSAASLGRLPSLTGDHARFNIFFAARNGFWTQAMQLRKVNGEWLAATRVLRNDGRPDAQTLYERADPGFPLNKAGKIDW